MTTQDRHSLRKLQDKVVTQLLRQGYTLQDTLDLLDWQNKRITVGDLNNYLYPQFEGLFRDATD